jgi:hypothetical protein
MPGRTLVVEFSSQPGGLATVALSNRPDVMVRAGAGAATFTTESDRLLIEGGVAPDTFAVEIPRDAPRVEIRASGRRVLLAERGSITTDAAADSGGMYRIELGGK